MGLTPKEFDNTIVNACHPYQVERGPVGYRLNHQSRRIDIRLSVEPPRQMASLNLPVTAVDIEFHNNTQEQIDAFMTRFMKHFHRGGG